MINSIIIKDFKSYENATLELFPLTVLVGANASGKSNALEAIRFLSWLAQGQKLTALQYKINQDEQVVRGQLNDLPRNSKTTFQIGCTQIYESTNTKLNLVFEVRNNDGIHIKQEDCDYGNDFLYKTVRPTQGESTDIQVEYNNFARGGKKPQITCSDQQGIFTQLASAARFSDGHSKAKKIIPKISSIFEKHLANILFLDPIPNIMREYSFQSDKELRGDGRNISSVLYALWHDPKHEKEDILSFIKSLPEQDIKEINFLHGPRGEVMIQLVETFGESERKIDAGLLSDGTLRVLAIAAALLSAPEESLVIIEEIDNGVHPSRAKQLLSSINKIAVKRRLNILISSHNPALLDALPIDVVPNVVFCYRNKQNGGSELLSLKNFPDFVELMSQGTLGDLITNGTLDTLIKSYDGQENKKSKALDWLKSIENI